MHLGQCLSRLHWLCNNYEGHTSVGRHAGHMEVPQHPLFFFPASYLCCSPIPILHQGLLISSYPLSCTVFFAKLNISHCSAPLPQKLNTSLCFNHGNALCCAMIYYQIVMDTVMGSLQEGVKLCQNLELNGWK